MSYRITITKLVENPNYEKERERFEQQNRWGPGYAGSPEGPRSHLEEQTLFTILNDDEFNAVRMAVLREMELEKEMPRRIDA